MIPTLRDIINGSISEFLKYPAINQSISKLLILQLLPFHIIFKLKSHSHFLNGMKPILTQGKKRKLVEENDASIDKTEYKISDVITEKNLYTLFFTLKVNKKIKSLFVSMNYPYTYETLMEYLQTITTPTLNLCTTLLNYSAPYLQITDSKNPQQVIIAIARQHPGETVSSFVLQGFISFLLSQNEEAVWLRSQFLFIVVPMVNIDGVQIGNFRCDVQGHDLNRIWNKTVLNKHPTVYEIKNIIKKHKSQIRFFIDLHGHSKKLNTFFYGCRLDGHAAKCRVYPKLMEIICPFFSFKDCIFKINKGKVATARAAVFNRVKDNQNMPNVFTLETSFFGYGSNLRFTISDLEQIGQDLLKAIFIYMEGHKSIMMEEYNNIDVAKIGEELEKMREQFEYLDNKLEIDSDSEAEKDLILEQQLSEDQIEDDDKSDEIVKSAKQDSNQNQKNVKQSIVLSGKEIQQLKKPHRNSLINNIIFPKKIELYEVQKPIKGEIQYPKTPNYSRNAIRIQRRASHFKDEVQYPNKSYHSSQQQGNQNQMTKESKESEQVNEQDNEIGQQNSIKQQQRLVNQTIAEKSFRVAPSQVQRKKRDFKKGEVLQLAKNEVGWKNQKYPLQIVSQSPQKNESVKQQQNSSQNKKNEGLSQGNRQKVSNRKVNEKDDVFLSQLLRGVWAMNQQKYGTHLGNNLKFKFYQQYDDARIFNDSQ